MIATKVIVITTLISLHEIGEASFLARWFRLLLWMLPLLEVEMDCGMLTSPEKRYFEEVQKLTYLLGETSYWRSFAIHSSLIYRP